MSQKLTFTGTDASLIISLLEYGLIVSNEENEDGSGTHFCVYHCSHPDGGIFFDTGHISEKQVDGYLQGKEFPTDSDIKAFLKWTGLSKQAWFAMPLVNKLHDLISYWGVENIMGTSYSPMTQQEAEERYLK